MSNEQMESRFTCCFGPFRTHVEEAAFLIAIFGSGIYIAQAYFCFSLHLFFSGLARICFALCHLHIIQAQRKRKPSHYLNYLIIVGISLVCDLVIGFITVVYMILYPEIRLDHGLTNFIIGLCWCAAINSWFHSVVYRAYEFMKKEQQQGQSYVGGGKVPAKGKSHGVGGGRVPIPAVLTV